MASFANVQVRSANATLVPWSVVCLDPSQTLKELFRSIKSGKFVIVKTSPELSLAVLQSVCVGKDRSSQFLVQKELNAVAICTAFGLYIRFIVSLDEPVTSAEDISRNAFAIMMQNQRRICAQAPSLPDAVVERTKKDKFLMTYCVWWSRKGWSCLLGSWSHASHTLLQSPLLCST